MIVVTFQEKKGKDGDKVLFISLTFNLLKNNNKI